MRFPYWRGFFFVQLTKNMDKEQLEQLKMFCKMCHYAKTNAAFGGNGITKADLYKKGMTDDVFNWLKTNHYCNEQKPGKPLWIAVNGNRYYPSQTIQQLEKKIADFEEKLKNE